jgi:hypothetical protein
LFRLLFFFFVWVLFGKFWLAWLHHLSDWIWKSINLDGSLFLRFAWFGAFGDGGEEGETVDKPIFTSLMADDSSLTFQNRLKSQREDKLVAYLRFFLFYVYISNVTFVFIRELGFCFVSFNGFYISRGFPFDSNQNYVWWQSQLLPTIFLLYFLIFCWNLFIRFLKEEEEEVGKKKNNKTKQNPTHNLDSIYTSICMYARTRSCWLALALCSSYKIELSGSLFSFLSGEIYSRKEGCRNVVAFEPNPIKKKKKEKKKI